MEEDEYPTSFCLLHEIWCLQMPECVFRKQAKHILHPGTMLTLTKDNILTTAMARLLRL